VSDRPEWAESDSKTTLTIRQLKQAIDICPIALLIPCAVEIEGKFAAHRRLVCCVTGFCLYLIRLIPMQSFRLVFSVRNALLWAISDEQSWQQLISSCSAILSELQIGRRFYTAKLSGDRRRKASSGLWKMPFVTLAALPRPSSPIYAPPSVFFELDGRSSLPMEPEFSPRGLASPERATSPRTRRGHADQLLGGLRRSKHPAQFQAEAISPQHIAGRFAWNNLRRHGDGAMPRKKELPSPAMMVECFAR